MTEKKKYIEFRVHVDLHANQTMLDEMGRRFQELIYDKWNQITEDNNEQSIDAVHVTYEIVSDENMERTDRLVRNTRAFAESVEMNKGLKEVDDNPFDTWEEKRGEK
jgi:hypothetical protein